MNAPHLEAPSLKFTTITIGCETSEAIYETVCCHVIEEL
jgi:hypothetical protein